MIGGGERASFFFVFVFCFLSFVFLGMFWLDSMLTARSECHVSREAAVIRSGNGTLHFWGGEGEGERGIVLRQSSGLLSTQAEMQIP